MSAERVQIVCINAVCKNCEPFCWKLDEWISLSVKFSRFVISMFFGVIYCTLKLHSWLTMDHNDTHIMAGVTVIGWPSVHQRNAMLANTMLFVKNTLVLVWETNSIVFLLTNGIVSRKISVIAAVCMKRKMMLLHDYVTKYE